MQPGERFGREARGDIPATLRVILRDFADYQTPAGKFRARAAFVTDPASKTSLNTATLWAKHGYGEGTTKAPEVVEAENGPIQFLRVIDIDVRGEGGRAWKVMTPQRWYVDLREDVFLDCLKARCVMQNDQQDGGLVIQGPFRWVRFGTQMRLALINSDLYRQIEQSAKAKADPVPKIRTKDLTIGGVYISSGDWVVPVVFLGRVRVQGQVRLAFLEASAADRPDGWMRKGLVGLLQQTFRDTISEQFLPGSRRAGTELAKFPVTLLSSHSLTRQIGAIAVPTDKLTVEGCRFSNGYGEPVQHVEGWL